MLIPSTSVAIAALFGLMIGSFMNVVIHRLPLGRNVATGRSKCPSCKKTIAAYDNIPVLSYVVLRGRCRRCAWRIPIRYPLVELLSGVAAGAIVWRYGLSLEALWLFAFVAIMIIITFIDWDHQIIPDPLSLGGVVLGWIGAAVCLDIGVLESVVGSLVGAGIVLGIAVIYRATRKVHGMGGGDVKLMAMIGAFLGWKMVFPVLMIAALFGSLYGLYLIRRGGDGQTAVAFGSFLAPAACLMLFAGGYLVDLYIRLAWGAPTQG
jgi:leader peptidase (prepilin peptidase)/N-methyltransferase